MNGEAVSAILEGRPQPRVLVVDDDPDLLTGLAQLLGAEGYRVATAATAEDALERCREETFHLLLSDLQLPGMSGIALIKALRDACPATRSVLITSHGSIRSAVLALKLGASDYLQKPIKPRRLLALCAQLTDELPAYLPNHLMAQARADVLRLGGLVTCAPDMRAVFERIRLAAAAEATVLVFGERGSGRERVARAIHARSARAAGPFVRVRARPLATEPVAVAIFGSERTTAGGGETLPGLPGLIDEAEGGVLFIDELADLDARARLGLLGLLETRRYARVGGRAERPANVRLMAAAGLDPAALVPAGALREDLLQAMRALTIPVPPLRARREDIPLLAADLLAEAAERHHKAVTVLPAETVRLLCAYAWPGNVRELRHVIEQAVLLARGDELAPWLLPQMLHRETAPAEVLELPIGTSMEAIEREVILRTLEAKRGNKTAAAEALGISRRSIYNKLAEYEAQGHVARRSASP
jgi:two-component system response regulator HydG